MSTVIAKCNVGFELVPKNALFSSKGSFTYYLISRGGVSKCLRLITREGAGGVGRLLRNQNFHFLPIFVIQIGQFSLITYM